MKTIKLEELRQSTDRNQWIHEINELRESLRSTGGVRFAKVTGLLLRAQRLQKVEDQYEVSPLDSWDAIYNDLKKFI